MTHYLTTGENMTHCVKYRGEVPADTLSSKLPVYALINDTNILFQYTSVCYHSPMICIISKSCPTCRSGRNRASMPVLTGGSYRLIQTPFKSAKNTRSLCNILSYKLSCSPTRVNLYTCLIPVRNTGFHTTPCSNVLRHTGAHHIQVIRLYLEEATRTWGYFKLLHQLQDRHVVGKTI